MRYVLALIVGAVLLAGCGSTVGVTGGAPVATGIDKAKLEQMIRSDSNSNLASQGMNDTVTDVSCVQDGDDWHFTCLMTGSDDSTATMKATCDQSGGGTCIWRPE